VRGVEAEIAWQLSDSLRLSTQASYLDAYNVLRPDAQCTTSQIATLLGRRIRTPAPGCAFVNGLQVQDLSGERLPYSPELSGNLILAHEWAMENGWTVDTAAGGNWESSFFVADDLDPFLRQKGYVKFNASVRITTPDRRFELAVIGTNLSDKRTYHSGNDLPLSAGSYYKFLDKPRTVTFQVRTNF
jgi:iron complex outermembrane receptor protein